MPYKNPADKKARRIAWKQENPEKVRQSNKSYYDRKIRKPHGRGQKPEKDLLLRKKRRLVANARNRARKKNLPFSLTVKNVHWPVTCPVFGIPLDYHAPECRPNCASIDRLIPSLGYVPDNVMVVSFRANTLKSNGTADEFARLAAFYRVFG